MDVSDLLKTLPGMGKTALRQKWQELFNKAEPQHLRKEFMVIENYLQDSSGPDIDIEVQKVSIEDLRSAPYKATVDFYGIAYSPVEHVETKRTLYTAHFVFLFRDSVPNDLIQVNPLGLAVTYFREDEAFK
jgi:type IV secretory pathway component VirB8